MDVRHGISNTWRRSSAAPLGVRGCSTGSPVTPVHRRSRLPSRQAAQPCLPASPASALSCVLTTTVDAAVLETQEVACQGPSQDACVRTAYLQTRLSKAHSSAASAALVVQDSPDEKLVATASMDKGMAIWRFYSPQGAASNGEASCDEETIEVTRLKVPGAPVFSLAKIPDVLPDGTIVRKRPKPSGIYLGTASKEVLTWMLGSKDVTDKVVLDGHTGWVRSLSVTGKWLFSCGCNFLRQWDTTFRTPKEVHSVRLFTGDILAIEATNGRVFTAGADGSLRSWLISRTGALEEGPRQERAHDGRIAGCVAGPVDSDRVFTVSYDGSVKAWSLSTLELVAEVRGAHGGEKIFCAAVGPNRVLFTGGDDKLIRAWDMDLNPLGAPLDDHLAPVRVLAAGRRGLLVSGDSEGDVCIWETVPVSPPQRPVAVVPAAAPAEAVQQTLAEAAVAEAAAVFGAQVDAATTAFGGAVAAAEALEALGRSEAAAAGGLGEACGAVEVSMPEATMVQLETMFASPSAAEPHTHAAVMEPQLHHPQPDAFSAHMESQPAAAEQPAVYVAAVQEAQPGPLSEQLAVAADVSGDSSQWASGHEEQLLVGFGAADALSGSQHLMEATDASSLSGLHSAAAEPGQEEVQPPVGASWHSPSGYEPRGESLAAAQAPAAMVNGDSLSADSAQVGFDAPGAPGVLQKQSAGEGAGESSGPVVAVNDDPQATDMAGPALQAGWAVSGSSSEPGGGRITGSGAELEAAALQPGSVQLNGNGHWHRDAGVESSSRGDAEAGSTAVVQPGAAAAVAAGTLVDPYASLAVAETATVNGYHAIPPGYASMPVDHAVDAGAAAVQQSLPVAEPALLHGEGSDGGGVAWHAGQEGAAPHVHAASNGWSAHAHQGPGYADEAAATAAAVEATAGSAVATEPLFAAAHAAVMGASVDLVAGRGAHEGGFNGAAGSSTTNGVAVAAAAAPQSLMYDASAAVVVGYHGPAPAVESTAATEQQQPSHPTVVRRLEVDNVAAAVAASCLSKEALAKVVTEGRSVAAAPAALGGGGGGGGNAGAGSGVAAPTI